MSGGANQSTGYAAIYGYAIPSGGYAANSNVVSYTDSVTGQWSLSYDTLNRLIGSGATSGHYAGETGCWTYDAFGNRKMEEFSTSTSTPCASVAGITYNSNNQVGGTTPPQTYDVAGNVLSDVTTGNHYLYDSQGRLCAMGVNLGGVMSYTQYIYDADGRRVAKGTQTSLQCPAPTAANGFTLTNQYLLDQSGEQVTELNGASGWLHTNAWIGGKLVATYDGVSVHFALTDPLGTKRVQVEPSGTPELNCASLPFGDDVAFSRTTNCYTPTNGIPYQDATENHFTGKERDTESGNDYFEARYYASSMGRMLSPDPSGLASSDPTNPQSFNLYSYVLNNPMIHIDPTGLTCSDTEASGAENSGSNVDGGPVNGDQQVPACAADPSGHADPPPSQKVTLKPCAPSDSNCVTVRAYSSSDLSLLVWQYPSRVTVPRRPAPNNGIGAKPSNGWDWDEKPHWPTPQPHPRQQSFGDCFNGAMKANALPGGSNTQNTLTATTTAATIWNLIKPNPVAKTVGAVNAWYNLSRIVPAALVCSDPDAHF
jgi:RHS repeat-associated protein